MAALIPVVVRVKVNGGVVDIYLLLWRVKQMQSFETLSSIHI